MLEAVDGLRDPVSSERVVDEALEDNQDGDDGENEEGPHKAAAFDEKILKGEFHGLFALEVFDIGVDAPADSDPVVASLNEILDEDAGDEFVTFFSFQPAVEDFVEILFLFLGRSFFAEELGHAADKGFAGCGGGEEIDCGDFLAICSELLGGFGGGFVEDGEEEVVFDKS